MRRNQKNGLYPMCKHLGWEYTYPGGGDNSLYNHFRTMYYEKEMSGNEIAEWLNENTPDHLSITARSVQRAITRCFGSENTRSTGDAFRLAVKRGRVNWVYKDNKIKRRRMPNMVRYAILKRDNNRCVGCGASARDDVLEVDHIIPVSEGGSDDFDNLQVLCRSCNMGKSHYNKEGRS